MLTINKETPFNLRYRLLVMMLAIRGCRVQGKTYFETNIVSYISQKTMKAELNIDTQELVREITSGVIKAVMPLLNHKTEADSFFTVKTLAQHLEVSEKWVYERVQFKEVPFYKLNGTVRFSKKDIAQWMEAHRTPAINALSRPLKTVKMI